MRTWAPWIITAAFAFTGCGKSDEKRGEVEPPPADPVPKAPPPSEVPPPPAVPPSRAPLPSDIPPPELRFEGEPVKQAADFPKEQWVRTTTFDGKPFLGFTYVDRSKGNSIKGEPTDGVSPKELSKKLNGFPGYTMQPIPEGHPLTPLTPAEVKKMGLPNPPDWLAHFR